MRFLIRGILPIVKQIKLVWIEAISPCSIQAKALPISRLSVYVRFAGAQFHPAIRGIINHFNDFIDVSIDANILDSIRAYYPLICHFRFSLSFTY